MNGKCSRKIRFKNFYRVETVAPDTVFLFSEKEKHLLRGRPHFLIASFLKQGAHTSDEIAQALENEMTFAEVYHVLERLIQKKFIEESHSLSLEFSAFCNALTIGPEEATLLLKKSKISISAPVALQLDSLISTLCSWGVQVTKDGQVDLSVIFTRDYLDVTLFSQINDKCPTLLVKPFGTEMWMGPFINEKVTPCYNCLVTCLKKNRLEESLLNKQNNIPLFYSHALAALKPSVETALQLTAMEIFKILVSKKSELMGNIYSFDFITLKMRKHGVPKFLNCPQCGEQKKLKTEPLSLVSRKKIKMNDGGYRIVAADVTLKKYEHLISPITGIVSDLEIIMPDPHGIMHVFKAGPNYSLAGQNYFLRKKHMRSCSAGKGKTDSQAKASALCEAIERYSGVFQGTEETISATYSQLKNDAIHHSNLLHFSDLQYNEREERNTNSDPKHFIPYRFDEAQEVDWVPAWSLTRKRHVYLPGAHCFYGYPQLEKHRFFVGDSNGCASGNCLEEAILQGFFELVERDAAAIWWYNRMRLPQVDLASFCDDHIDSLVCEYRERGLKMIVLDLTHDLKIPVFVAIAYRTETEDNFMIGFGAHLNPRIALSRAICELNQFLALNSEYDSQRVSAQPFLLGAGMRNADDYCYTENSDLLEDIKICQKKIEEAGMELIVLDQTRPETGLPVVKVVVPDLRHFWPRFAPGRLYDVPVKLGWLDKKLEESKLNPIGIFW